MMNKGLLTGFFILLLVGISPAKADPQLFKRIIGFGESTSDIGNTWILKGREFGNPADWDPDNPYSLPSEPVPPLYYNGRWSNGPIWLEILSGLLDTRGKLKPSLEGGQVYAYADSVASENPSPFFNVWTGEALNELAPTIGDQIFSHALEGISRHHLAVLWVGFNDILFAWLTSTSSDILETQLNNIVEQISQHLTEIVNLGARHILVPNMIDGSIAPIFTQSTDLQRESLREAIMYFNGALKAMLNNDNGLKGAWENEVTIYVPDFFSVFDTFLSECSNSINKVTPAALVYLNQLEADDTLEIDNQFFDKFVFWDTIHPTATIHSLLADAAESLILTGSDVFEIGECPLDH